jgi:hypothetical protein
MNDEEHLLNYGCKEGWNTKECSGFLVSYTTTVDCMLVPSCLAGITAGWMDRVIQVRLTVQTKGRQTRIRADACL